MQASFWILKPNFSLVHNQKSQDARAVECGGCGMNAICFCTENCYSALAMWPGALSCCRLHPLCHFLVVFSFHQLIHMRHRLCSQADWWLSPPSPFKLFQLSQKLKVSYSKAGLPASLAHFWSCHSIHTPQFFETLCNSVLFQLYVWWNLKILEYSAAIGNEETLYQCICNCPGTFESCDSPWPDMSMHTSI